jgi:4'-phosphopantetheinyl transferase EntD
MSPSSASASASAIVPAGVVVVEVREDPADAVLLPEERAIVANAVDKRRREFTTGRHCARAALAKLGIPPVPILVGGGGEPLWPDGVVGSISHCAGYRGAAVARASDLAGVGLDAEPNEPLPSGIADAVAVPDERAQLDRLAAVDTAVCWDRLLFSAKESVYKVWYPSAGRMLDFDEAHVVVEADGTFRAQLLVAGPFQELHGRWVADDSILLTAIAL